MTAFIPYDPDHPGMADEIQADLDAKMAHANRGQDLANNAAYPEFMDEMRQQIETDLRLGGLFIKLLDFCDHAEGVLTRAQDAAIRALPPFRVLLRVRPRGHRWPYVCAPGEGSDTPPRTYTLGAGAVDFTEASITYRRAHGLPPRAVLR